MKANEALYSTHGKTYEIRQIPYVLYTASGGFADWALGEAKIPYEYSIELGDMGALGFILQYLRKRNLNQCLLGLVQVNK